MRFLACRLYQSWDKKGDTSPIIKKDCFSHISPLGYIVGDNLLHISLLFWHKMRLSLLWFTFQWKYGKCLPSSRAVSFERRSAFPSHSSSFIGKIERSRGRRGLDILEIIPSEEIGVSFVLSREKLVSIKSSALRYFNSARILCHSLSSSARRDSP